MESDQKVKGKASNDPVDSILPRPFAWWNRLFIAGLVVTAAIIGSLILGRGNVYPDLNYDETMNSFVPRMQLSDEGNAVVITVDLTNSGNHDLWINSARIDLPGAEVVSIDARHLTPVEGFQGSFMSSIDPLPVVAITGWEASVLVTFVPTTCTDSDGPWGEASIDVSVANSRWPSLHRNYDLGPVVDYLGFRIDNERFPGAENLTEPLAAACALLGL